MICCLQIYKNTNIQTIRFYFTRDKTGPSRSAHKGLMIRSGRRWLDGLSMAHALCLAFPAKVSFFARTSVHACARYAHAWPRPCPGLRSLRSRSRSLAPLRAHCYWGVGGLRLIFSVLGIGCTMGYVVFLSYAILVVIRWFLLGSCNIMLFLC